MKHFCRLELPSFLWILDKHSIKLKQLNWWIDYQWIKWNANNVSFIVTLNWVSINRAPIYYGLVDWCVKIVLIDTNSDIFIPINSDRCLDSLLSILRRSSRQRTNQNNVWISVQFSKLTPQICLDNVGVFTIFPLIWLLGLTFALLFNESGTNSKFHIL